MPRILAKLFLLALGIALAAQRAFGGAFLLPQGYGQFIAAVGSSEGSRRFDRGGRIQPTPAYRKATVGGYLEYGWTNWLTLIAAPTLSHQNDVAANSITGSDASAIGARLMLYGAAYGGLASRTLSVQVLVQPPLGDGDRAAAIATGGTRTAAVDGRLQFGQSFAIGSWLAFVDVAPGARLRADPLPAEARIDLTAGLRPIPPLLLLAQDFVAAAPSRGALIERTFYSKLQLSAVYDLSPRWSLQVGAFRTIAGRNAIRETGPMAAVWIRF